MKKTLKDVENYQGYLDVGTVISLNPERAEKLNIKQRAAQIFQIHVLKTDREAKLMVKTVEGQDGIRAWQKLHKHYHRRILAKSIRDHKEILYPRPLRHTGEVMVAVMDWEDKVAKVEKAYENIPELLKAAALVEMMPTEIKDTVMMQPQEHQDYSKLKQKVFSRTANKIPLDKGPVPMDIGAMAYHCGQCGGEEAEVDVGAINGSCYRCGGWGHLAKDCATPWNGKGKGEADKAKGKGKG